MHAHPHRWQTARHLLNRSGFGGRPEEIAAFASLTRAEAADRLLTAPAAPLSEPDWLADATAMTAGKLRTMTREERQQLQKSGREQAMEMLGEWVTAMTQTADPAAMLRQKLIFFWHGLFATSIQKVQQPAFVYRQLDLFHRHALGNYADLLHAIVRDPAMLRYLDNTQNKRGQPNENLARELMELFALGPGHYTETDIREGARALTGYAVGPGGFVFRPFLHDDGEKTIFGKTGHWNGDDFVNLILGQSACAEFVSARLWRYFTGAEPRPATAAELASIFRDARYEVKPLLHAIFTHDDFHAPDTVGQQIKSPLQLVVGSCRLLGICAVDSKVYLGVLRMLGQVPYLPPNVKGWPDGRAWIDTSRLIARLAFAELVAEGGGQNGMMRMMRGGGDHSFTVDATPLAGGASDPAEVVNQVVRVLLTVPPTDAERATLLADYRRDLASQPPGVALRRLAAGAMLLPQYQLA